MLTSGTRQSPVVIARAFFLIKKHSLDLPTFQIMLTKFMFGLFVQGRRNRGS